MRILCLSLVGRWWRAECNTGELQDPGYQDAQFDTILTEIKACFKGALHSKGTNGRQKTYEVSHVYSIFYSGFMCQTTVIFGITKDGSLY